MDLVASSGRSGERVNRISTRADASVPYEYTSEAAWESPYPTFNAAPPDLVSRAPKMCTTAPPDCAGAARARRIGGDAHAFGCGFHSRIHDDRPSLGCGDLIEIQACEPEHRTSATWRYCRHDRERRPHAIHARCKLCSSARGKLTSAACWVRWVGAGKWVAYASHHGPLANIFAAAFR